MTARIHGSDFEYRFCALVFVRIKNKEYNFKLVSNVKGLGEFGEVVVEYLDDNSRKSHIFGQLKSIIRHTMSMVNLLAEMVYFRLRKYDESYTQIEEKFNCNEEGDKLEGSIDESLFILYTNTDVGKNIISYKFTDVGEEEFLITDGSVLQFNEKNIDTGFSWFPCVYKRTLRWFPSFQVATKSFSCSPPDLNFLVTFFHICLRVK